MRKGLQRRPSKNAWLSQGWPSPTSGKALLPVWEVREKRRAGDQ